MIIYNYNYLGQYIYSTEADIDPEEPDKFLIPAFATTVEPPSVDDQHIQVWNGESWDVVEKTYISDNEYSSRLGYKRISDNNENIDVTGIEMIVMENTSVTTVSAILSGFDGQEVTFIFINGNTTIENNTAIKLSGAVNFVGVANATLKLVNLEDVWYEVSRSINSL